MRLELENETVEERRDFLSQSPLVGHLCAAVAHKIRNPLSSLSAFLQILVSQLKDDPSMQELAKVLEQDAGKVEAALRELIDFSADFQPQTAEGDFCVFMLKSLRLFRPQFEAAGIGLKADWRSGNCLTTISEIESRQCIEYIFNYQEQLLEKGDTLYLRTIHEKKMLYNREEIDICSVYFSPKLEITDEEKSSLSFSESDYLDERAPGAMIGMSIIQQVMQRYNCYCYLIPHSDGKKTILLQFPKAKERESHDS